MNVKVIKRRPRRKERLYENVDSTLRDDFDDHIDVYLFYDPPREQKVITLPDEGDVIYFENTHSGKTTGKVEWVDREEEPEELKLRVGRG